MHLIIGENFLIISSGDSLALSVQLLFLICSHIQYLPLLRLSRFMWNPLPVVQLQRGFIF